MRRRSFLTTIAAPGVSLWCDNKAWATGENKNNKPYGVSQVNKSAIKEIGGKSLEELRDFHRRELSEEYIKLWDKSGIDWQYGGVFPLVNMEGDPAKVTDKEMYYQGRALWVFSYIYNHFERHERHLKAARLTRDFLVKNCRDRGGYWISKFTRDGKMLQPSFNIYGDIYMVLGLGEYYKATGDKESLALAIESAHGVMDRITSPSYQHSFGHGPTNEPGTKRLGTWQHFLSALTPLLRYTQDDAVDAIARSCVRYMLERHWRPELGVVFELLDDRFEPFRADPHRNSRFISGWHSIQAAWMTMDEALRRGDTRMFLDSLEMGRMTLEKCWVDGTRFSGLVTRPNPEQPLPDPTSVQDVPSGAIDDALVYCLMAIEHTHETWALKWYERILATGNKNPERWIRRCLLHHPRRLFFSIEILDQMIARGGRVSNFLETS